MGTHVWGIRVFVLLMSLRCWFEMFGKTWNILNIVKYSKIKTSLIFGPIAEVGPVANVEIELAAKAQTKT